MLGGGQKSGSVEGIGEAGDFEEDGFGGAVGVDAGAIFDAALAKSASETEEAGYGADALLLVFGEFGEGGVFELGLGPTMVTDGPGEDLPFFGSPGRRDGKTAEVAPGGFAGVAGAAFGADAGEAGGGAGDAARGTIAKERGDTGLGRGGEDGHGNAGDLCGAAGGGGAGASHGRGLCALVLRQAGGPVGPDAGLAESEFTVLVEALVAGAVDHAVPFGEKLGNVGLGFVAYEEGEHVEIVDFAQDILQALELGAPRFVATGEKAFHRVTEFFDADAQGVPGVRLLLANGAGVEALGFFETLESEAFGGKAAGGDQADAFAEFAVEALPGFFVELFGSANHGVEQAGLAGAEMFLEEDAQAVVFRAVGLDPVAHDLRVAQRAEAAKEFSGKVAEFAPKRVGIDFRHHGGDGTATPNGHAKIVDGVFVGSAPEIGELG